MIFILFVVLQKTTNMASSLRWNEFIPGGSLYKIHFHTLHQRANFLSKGNLDQRRLGYKIHMIYEKTGRHGGTGKIKDEV